MSKKILVIDNSSRGDEFLEFLKKFNNDRVYKSELSYYEIQLQRTTFDLIICHIGPTVGWGLSRVPELIKRIRSLKSEAFLITVSEGVDFRDISKSSGADLTTRYGDLMERIKKNATEPLSAGDILHSLCKDSKYSGENESQKLNTKDVILDFHILDKNVMGKLLIRKKKVFILTDDRDSAIVLKRALSLNRKVAIKILKDISSLRSEIKNKKPYSTLIILDILKDTAFKVRTWLWEGIRLNSKGLGEIANLPVLVVGSEQDFKEKNPDEYLVFEEMNKYHRYLQKPFLLKDLIEAINNLGPISMNSLPMIVSRYAPNNIKNGYFHILKNSDYIPGNEEESRIELHKRQHMVERIRSMKCTDREVKKAENLLREFEKNVTSQFSNILEIK